MKLFLAVILAVSFANNGYCATTRVVDLKSFKPIVLNPTPSANFKSVKASPIKSKTGEELKKIRISTNLPDNAKDITAPVFDPINSYQFQNNADQTVVVIGATDSQGQRMHLDVSGLNVFGTFTAVDEPGRIEVLVGLRGTDDFPYNTVTYSVQNASGATTIAEVPIYTHQFAYNSPMTFGPISHKTIQVNKDATINVMIKSADTGLTLDTSLPYGAFYEEIGRENGYIAGRVYFRPQSFQMGYNEIQLYAQGSRGNMAAATIRLNVQSGDVTAPAIDPVSSYELQPNQQISLNAGATDSHGQRMRLTTTGLTIIGSTVTTDNPGRIQAVVALRGVNDFPLSFLTYSARNQSGNITIVQVPVYSHQFAITDPVRFSNISHQTIQVNRDFSTNISVRNTIPGPLNLKAVLPFGAVFTITSQRDGYVQGRIDFRPQGFQMGYNDVSFYAGTSRGGIALATIRLNVAQKGIIKEDTKPLSKGTAKTKASARATVKK